MTLEEYRSAVRLVPCPACGATPRSRCWQDFIAGDRAIDSGTVDYVHDDRSNLHFNLAVKYVNDAATAAYNTGVDHQ